MPALPFPDRRQTHSLDFLDDPEWQRVYEESQRDGRIVEKVESVFLDATDYSQLE